MKKYVENVKKYKGIMKEMRGRALLSKRALELGKISTPPLNTLRSI